MEWLVAVIAIVVVFWFLASRSSTEQSRKLRHFEHTEWLGNYGRDDWEVDFVDMVAVFRRTIFEDLEEKEKIVFALHRNSSGRWRIKRTEQSCSEGAVRLQQDLRELEDGAGKSIEERRRRLEKMLHELESPAKWHPMAGEVMGPLESQYQRFVARYPT